MNRNYKFRDTVAVFLVIILFVLSSYFFYPNDTSRLFLSVLLLVPLLLLFKSIVEPIHYSAAFLFLSAAELAAGNEKIATYLGTYSYWLFVTAGVIFLIQEIRKKFALAKSK